MQSQMLGRLQWVNLQCDCHLIRIPSSWQPFTPLLEAFLHAEEEPAASTPPPVPKTAAPANLVTSWAQKASAAPGLLTAEATSLMHSAGAKHSLFALQWWAV